MPYLLATVACAASTTAQTWFSPAAPGGPSIRRAGAMAFDPATSRLMLYGGLVQTPSQVISEMWTYGGSWSQVVNTALPRWGHRMVHDVAANRMVTFGGYSPTITGFANDTLEWIGGTWIAVPSPTSPTPRALYGMCYDSTRQVHVLFGGRTASGVNAETWEWNGVSWVQRLTANTPPAREEMVMEYDPTLHRVVLFGGLDGDTNTLLGDTWFFDGSDWTEIQPGTSPSPRFRAAAALDTRRQRIVLFGGFDGTDIVTDTYEFRGDSWTAVSTGGAAPPNATETYHGYDPQRNKFVIFGGYSGAFSDELWEFTGVNTGTFAVFGNGCDTLTTTPTIAGSVPTIGQALQLTFGGLQNDDELVLTVFGFTNTDWTGIPLPLDLGLIGLSGCPLNVSPDVFDLAVNIGGTANYALAIPNQASLVGVSLYVQGVTLDIDGPTLLTGITPGGRALIGQP